MYVLTRSINLSSLADQLKYVCMYKKKDPSELSPKVKQNNSSSSRCVCIDSIVEFWAKYCSCFLGNFPDFTKPLGKKGSSIYSSNQRETNGV